MRGIIFCKDSNSIKNEGNSKLREIIEKYKKKEITSSYVFSPNKSFADFSNGDKWEVIVADRSGTCGRRCNIAYVERSIDYKTYCCLISPCLYDFPYSAIRLWGEGDLHIDDRPELPFR